MRFQYSPCRWNSLFHALRDLLSYDCDTLAELTDKLDTDTLSDRNIAFLNEYCLVSAPLAIQLDVLQGEQHMYYGFLLPCIQEVEKQVQKIRETQELKYCDPLAKAILTGLRTRFGKLLEQEVIGEGSQEDALLATVSHPRLGVLGIFIEN